MRATVIPHASGGRGQKSLIARAGLVRTFGGLAAFVAVTFLCTGIYVLDDALANPMNTGSTAIIGAAFLLTLASVLLFFLINPRKKLSTARSRRLSATPAPTAQPVLPPVSKEVTGFHPRDDLPYQRFYVDHSRIRP